MKTHYLLSLIISLVLWSCGTNIESKNITGNWSVISFKADMPELNSQIIKLGEKEALSSHYVFREDYSFQMKSAIFPEGIEGKWEIDQESNSLILNGDTKPQIQKIIFLDSRQMQWIQTIDSLGTIKTSLERTQ